jgi:glycosyltransferase involved in cell wall biosynthesis
MRLLENLRQSLAKGGAGQPPPRAAVDVAVTFQDLRGIVNTSRISVVVATRNRANDAGACLRCILANPGADFDVIVVDQSDNDATKEAMAPFLADPRFRYLRSETRGLSISRNVGIASTRAPIIAFTDDDCRVREDWIASLQQVFGANPDAAIVFGRVTVPSDVDGSHRYAAQFEPITREYQNCFPPADTPWGIGANMAFRRSVFDEVGTFDPLLGAGAKFPAAEEYDLTIRSLAAGMKVLNAAEVSVLHLGVRESDVASALVSGYGVAIGAALAKHVRLGTKNGVYLLAGWVASHGTSAVRNAVLGRRPTNLRFVAGLLTGIARSLRQPIDRSRFVYEANQSVASGCDDRTFPVVPPIGPALREVSPQRESAPPL